MPSGKVKWFNAKKGYGFISEDKTDRDIFLHVSSLEKSTKITLLPSCISVVYLLKDLGSCQGNLETFNFIILMILILFDSIEIM